MIKTGEQEKYGAAEKCRAVLAVWTEKKKASGLCRASRFVNQDCPTSELLSQDQGFRLTEIESL